jgi:hypothetical protein
MEDEASIRKARKKREQAANQEMGTSISPLRRKNTMDANAQKRGSAIIKPNKRLSLLKGP